MLEYRAHFYNGLIIPMSRADFIQCYAPEMMDKGILGENLAET